MGNQTCPHLHQKEMAMYCLVYQDQELHTYEIEECIVFTVLVSAV